MAVSCEEYLEDPANSCLLIVISRNGLDEEDCREAFSNFGTVKGIELTADFRAAFVQFECEHAPHLFARCFEHGKTKGDLAHLMPKNVDVILPGCSVTNFLFLHTKSTLPTDVLYDHFSHFCNMNAPTIYRPGPSSLLSSRIVVELCGVRASSYHLDQMWLSGIDHNGTLESFYAVPPLEPLIDTSLVFDSDGCEKCKVEAISGYNIFEEKEPPSKFPSITEESEKRRWRMGAQNQVSPLPVSPPAVMESPEKIEWKCDPITVFDHIFGWHTDFRVIRSIEEEERLVDDSFPDFHNPWAERERERIRASHLSTKAEPKTVWGTQDEPTSFLPQCEDKLMEKSDGDFVPRETKKEETIEEIREIAKKEEIGEGSTREKTLLEVGNAGWSEEKAQDVAPVFASSLGVQRSSMDDQPVTEKKDLVPHASSFFSSSIPPPSPYPFTISADGYAPQLDFDYRRWERKKEKKRPVQYMENKSQESTDHVLMRPQGDANARGSEENEQGAFETREVPEIQQRREERGPGGLTIHGIDQTRGVEISSQKNQAVTERGEETEKDVASVLGVWETAEMTANDELERKEEHEPPTALDCVQELVVESSDVAVEESVEDGMDEGEIRSSDARSTVEYLAAAFEMIEDLIVEREDVHINEELIDSEIEARLMKLTSWSELIEEDPPSALVSAHEMSDDASDVIGEEPEDPGDRREDEVKKEAYDIVACVANANVNLAASKSKKIAMEQREDITSSSAPIRRWNRMSVVDQQEDGDYRSMESEYNEWLTREDADTRGDSMAKDSSDSEAEMIPLPSSLPVLTWGGPLPVSPEPVLDSTPTAVFGRVIPTFSRPKTTVSSATDTENE